MEQAVILSFLGANLLATLGLIVKLYVPHKKNNPNGVADEKLDNIESCINRCSDKLDRISTVLYEIRGKLSG